jgi:hypothetical protein
MGLAATPDPGGLLQQVMGVVTPVPEKGRTVVLGGEIERGVSDDTQTEAEGVSKKDKEAGASETEKEAEPKPPGEKPEAAAPEIGQVAQNIEAGLKAIGIPRGLWKSLLPQDQRQLAKGVLKDLYEQRAAYGRSVRWTFAPEAELLGLTPNGERSALAVDLLKVRAGIAAHQIAIAEKEIELQQASVAYAEQDVELRKKAVEQQDVVTDILKELLKHFERWRALSVWGVIFLTVALVFSLVLMVWLFILAGDDKISDWALPASIFALALFVISPAVLLLRERPLKGIDEAGWPGVDSSKPQDQASASGDAAQAATAPAATAPAATGTAPAAPTSTTTSTTTFAAQRPG